jgi:hypothetical protein
MWRATGTGNGGGGNGRRRQRQGDSPVVLLLHPPSNASASSACTRLETSKAMVEAGGIGEGGRATAGEDMDGAMADCGGRGTGGGAAAEALVVAEIRDE